MTEGIPRPLLALTAIVVLAALYVGVKDYFQKPKEAQPTASAVLAVAQSNTASMPKKTSSAKLKRSRMSALAANATNPAQPEDTEKPFIGQQSAEADAKAMSVNDPAPNAIDAQAAPEPAEAAMNRRPRAENELKTNVVGAAFSVPQCIPLPNSVMRGDVDAPYYENWAREYSCQVR